MSEKRVYTTRRDRTEAYVASALGLTRVELAGDQVGRFSLVFDEPTTDVAGADGQLVVATDEDVYVGTGEGFEPTDFGPAAVVTVADGTPVAASPAGRLARLEGDTWVAPGTVERPRRGDGDLLATADGVVRIGEEPTALGGGDVRDVASAGPFAATAEGIVRDDGEWLREYDGDCSLVAADGDRAGAVGDAGLLVRRDGAWDVHERPIDAPIADLAYGDSLCAVTADGTVLVAADARVAADGQAGWGSRALGVREVSGFAVV